LIVFVSSAWAFLVERRTKADYGIAWEIFFKAFPKNRAEDLLSAVSPPCKSDSGILDAGTWKI
jgi:hypothetical protein